jgi:hypothetical protein
MRVFEEFLDSYFRHPAGSSHELILIFKGFSGYEWPPGFLQLVRDLPVQTLFTSDVGFDIGPYFEVVREFDYRFFVFLNSFATLRAADWLRKLVEPARAANVGAVGATGSWETQYGLSPRQEEAFYLKHKLKQLRCMAMGSRIPAFPNYHLRTNAFIARATILRRLKVPVIRTKKDAYAFESGPKSLTRQLLDLNQQVLVVDRNGAVFEKEEWARSRTFKQAAQENLLVADNQTSRYEAASMEERRRLSLIAWGEQSDFA